MSTFGSVYTNQQAEDDKGQLDGQEFRWYGGTAPANAEAPIGSAELLATNVLNAGTAAANVYTSSASAAAATAAGTVTFARVYKGADCLTQVEIGNGLTIDEAVLGVGDPVGLTTITVTHPGE